MIVYSHQKIAECGNVWYQQQFDTDAVIFASYYESGIEPGISLQRHLDSLDESCLHDRDRNRNRDLKPGPDYFIGPEHYIRHKINAQISTSRPVWSELPIATSASNLNGRLFQISMQIEFGIDVHSIDKYAFKEASFTVTADCYIDDEPFPELISPTPKREYATKVKGNTIKVSNIFEGSESIQVNLHQPEIIALTGGQANQITWHFTPKSTQLLGIFDLSCQLHLPIGCTAAVLHCLSTAELMDRQRFLGLELNSQRHQMASDSPRIVIPETS